MITIDSLKGIIGSRDPAELMEIAKGLGIDVSSFLGSDFDINNFDMDDLSSLLGEGKNLDDLLSTFLPGTGNKHDKEDDTFSFIIPDETLKLVDGLLLNILPIETLALIDQAIDIDRLFEITLPTETFSVINDAILENAPIEIDELLSTLLPEGAFPPVDKTINTDQSLPTTHSAENNETSNPDETFSFILPAETVKLLDGLLLQLLPPEKLIEIDQAIDIDRLFEITLPTETFSVINAAILENAPIEIDELLSTILPEGTFPPVDKTIHTDQSLPTTHLAENNETSNPDETFSFIIPEETLKLVDGLLLNILPIETLALIDQAIGIDRLFEITLPTETFSVINDAIIGNETVEIARILETIIPDESISSVSNEVIINQTPPITEVSLI